MDKDRPSSPSQFTVMESWQATPDARSYINALLKRNKRRHFGLLEKPFEEDYRTLPMLHKKLFLAGKSGVGKTSTVDKLAGRDIRANHEDTVGIQTHTLHWPIKLSTLELVVLVKLELWDTGERALNWFDHILPACQSATDGTLFFFSYEDRKSWEELPKLMSDMSRGGGSDLRIVVGTHSDSLRREVTGAEVDKFQRQHSLVVLPIANTNGPRLATEPSTPDGREGIKEIAPFMNALSQVLLAHEQKLRSPFALSLESSSVRTASPDEPAAWTF